MVREREETEEREGDRDIDRDREVGGHIEKTETDSRQRKKLWSPSLLRS